MLFRSITFSDLLNNHPHLLLGEAVNALANADSSTDAPVIADLIKIRSCSLLHFTAHHFTLRSQLFNYSTAVRPEQREEPSLIICKSTTDDMETEPMSDG